MKKIIKSSQIKNVLTDEQIFEFTNRIISKCVEICDACFLDGNTGEAAVYKGDPAFEFEKYFRPQDLNKDEKYIILKEMGLNFSERKDEIDLFSINILKEAKLICNNHFNDGVYLDENNDNRTEKDIDPKEFINKLKDELGEAFVSSYGREIFAEESFYDADIGEKIRKKFKIK